MGAWIFFGGVVIAMAVAAFFLWFFNNKPFEPIASLIAIICALFVLSASASIVRKVDPEFASLSTTVKCAQCGSEIGDNDKFCPGCELTNSSEKHCAECNEKVGIDYKFCPKCGANLDLQED